MLRELLAVFHPISKEASILRLNPAGGDFREIILRGPVLMAQRPSSQSSPGGCTGQCLPAPRRISVPFPIWRT